MTFLFQFFYGQPIFAFQRVSTRAEDSSRKSVADRERVPVLIAEFAGSFLRAR